MTRATKNKYLVTAKGYFGRSFNYIVSADDKADALVVARALLEQENEYLSGNVDARTLRVEKKVRQ